MGSGAQLSAFFRASLGAAAADFPADTQLERELERYVADARRAHPALPLPDEAFVRYLALRRAGVGLPPNQHAGDLLLAAACSLGNQAAIKTFRERYLSVIQRVLASRSKDPALMQDVTQLVLERLLVGTPSASPKIAEYRGTGPLRSWVATTAATTLLMAQRGVARREETLGDSGIAGQAGDLDPELRYLKERYRTEVEAAIALAFQQLNDRERTLLRLNVAERMSIDQLGAMYGASRATIARWLARARETIATNARRELQARLHLRDSEYESIVRLVQSQLDVSMFIEPPSSLELRAGAGRKPTS